MSEPQASLAKPDNIVKNFDINEGAGDNGIRLPSGPAFLPEALNINSIEAYAQHFEGMMADAGSPTELTAKALGIRPAKYGPPETMKGLSAPPAAFAFGRMSYMPDAAVNGGLLQWPGIAPEALRKVVRENIAPQLIIGMRIDDVLRYSNHSSKIWRPGWRIEARETDMDDDEEIEKANDKDSKKARKARQAEIKEAERFVMNSNIETTGSQARDRDAKFLRGFQGFLSAAVRDSLTFDGLAVWTDMDGQDRVKGYSLLPAGNIRLAVREGYGGDSTKFAALVNETGTIVQAFTRQELTFYVRNPRTDVEAAGYGYSEVEMALRLIKGFQNALDLNIDIFDRSSIAQGILTISGGTVTQKQLDLLNRLLTNMKRGITKAWALPVIGLPEGAKLEVIDLSRLKGNEAYYKEFINMLAGALCTLWRFPVRRLGYRISGGHRDAEPLPDDSKIQTVDEDDPGLAPLLTHLEVVINEYLIWSRWPHLQFKFCGKSPIEDARAYEFQSLAKSWGEKRSESGLPPLESLVRGGDEDAKKLKLLAKIMSICPTDPNLSGAFQTLASKLMADDQEDEAVQGNLMNSKKDPARSQAHGHTSGVRRNSKQESGAGKH